MDRALRCEKMAEVIFLPVRHHSPACSYHLQKMIEKVKPSMILIEGPENENSKIQDMLHEETKAPFAVYYSYNDKKGLISEEKKQYKCYYPFLDYSPEYVALKTANNMGIEAEFIDLCYRDILIACSEEQGLLKEAEQNNYNDDYLLSQNEYIKKLVEKTGLRHFDELWEKYFELNGLSMESEEWFKQLLGYCNLARENSRQESLLAEGCIQREEHMAHRIYEKISKTDSPVIVVTGGFHTSALKHRVEELLNEKFVKTLPQTVDENQASYLVAYSMKAADALNGYASGMPYASFYQTAWEMIQSGSEDPYSRACFEYIVESGRAARKKGLALSTYDEICAQNMIEPLSRLRGKQEPGAYELMDVILSSYVKGEYNLANSEPVAILRNQMTGLKKGNLCSQSDVPPILNDFEVLCKKYKIQSATPVATEVTFSIFAKKLHREKSIFFHRLEYLNTGFVKLEKGPNLKTGADRNLIREIWKYKWTVNLTAALIDVSVYGGTIEEACLGLMHERMTKTQSAKDFSAFLTDAFVMGLTGELNKMFGYAQNMISSDEDFYSLAECFERLMTLQDMQELYLTVFPVDDLLQLVVRKLIMKLPDMLSVTDRDVSFVMKTLKSLSQFSNGVRYSLGTYFKNSFEDILIELYESDDIGAGLFGCVAGLLYTAGLINIEKLKDDTYGFLKGSETMIQQNAQYFRGLFFATKDVVFICEDFLQILKQFIENADADDFMLILPELRLAFAGFTPGETDRIAAKVAAWYKVDELSVLFGQGIDPRWIAYGEHIDTWIRDEYGN